MGFIANLVKSGGNAPLEKKTTDSRGIWRNVFGSSGVTKEDSFNKPRENPTNLAGDPRTTPLEGSYNRSASQVASVERLLVALRSRAPGGWSDDRWEQTRHFVGIAYVAIHRQNEQLSQAEFQVFRKDEFHPDGKVPVENNHPLVQLLEKPNPDDNFGDLMANWNLQMDLTGMSLSWMVPNKLQQPMEIYPIPTALAIPQPASNPDYPQGFYRIQPVYPYGPFSSFPAPATAVGAAIPAEWMMRIKYPHPFLRYDGYSPLSAMRLHMDEVESVDRSRWYSMKRSIRPDAVLNFDDVEGSQPLTDPEVDRIIAQFEAELQGAENAGKIFVGQPGAKLEPWGTSPREMDYQGGWDQLTSFVLGGFGITKPAAGMIEDASYSTLFATLKQLYWLTLEPKASRIAQKLTRYLAPFFGDDLIIEIRCRRIDDHDVTFQKLGVAMQAFAVTKNEVRKELDFPVTQEMWGNEIAGIPPPPMPVGPDGQPLQIDENGQPIEDNGVMNALMGDEMEEEDDMEKDRPKSGKMSEGALGPKMKRLEILREAKAEKRMNERVNRIKELNGHFSRDKFEIRTKDLDIGNTKSLDIKPEISFLDQIKEVVLNGHS